MGSKPLAERLLAILTCATLLSVTGIIGLPASLAAWLVVLVIMTARAATRATGIVFVALTLYAVMAWIAAANGGHYYPPFPSLALIEQTTLLDLRSVIAAYLAVEALFGARAVDAAIRTAARRALAILRLLSDTPFRPIVLTILLVVGALDWLAVLNIGVGTVLSSARRAHADALLLASDHNIQFVVIAASIAASSFIVFSSRRIGSAFALIVCWAPFVLVGSRKELLLVAAAVAVLVGTSRARRWLGLIGAVLAFLFVRPVLSTGDFYDALHEFILPQYMHFALEMGLIAPDFAGSFLERAQFLLPSVLRASEPVDMALAFYQSGTTLVGVGASPFAEAATIVPGAPTELMFALVFAGLVGVLLICQRRLPFLSILIFAQLLTLGRSDTWIALFFVVYTALFLHVVTMIFLSRRKNHAHLPSHRQHDRQAGSSRPAHRQSATTERVLLPHCGRTIGSAPL